MQRKEPFAVGSFYHIYNRGTDRRVIFSEPNDYNRFLGLMYAANSTRSFDAERFFGKGRSFASLFSEPRGEPLTDIGTYCLMPNHFHFLLHERVQGGITKFMRKLGTAYSMYYNSKHSRTGTLFEGRFKSVLVDRDPYLEYLYAYIHLNPVKFVEPKWKEGIQELEKVRTFLSRYTYSSYLDYLGERRPENAIVNRDPEMWNEYFATPRDFRALVGLWLRALELEERGKVNPAALWEAPKDEEETEAAAVV